LFRTNYSTIVQKCAIVYDVSIPFYLFCKGNGCQNAAVNNAIEAVLKYMYTNVKVD